MRHARLLMMLMAWLMSSLSAWADSSAADAHAAHAHTPEPAPDPGLAQDQSPLSDHTDHADNADHAHQPSFGALRFERLERAYSSDANATLYDLYGWYGGTYDRVVIKAEGEVAQGKLHEARSELLWSHALAPFWDSQLGVRHDAGDGPNRAWLAFGIEGLAPYWFDVEATAYLGTSGRTALRLAASYELLITQRLILQPRVEVNVYGKRDNELMRGTGLADAVVGLRLRYEFSRQFAPYLGVERSGKTGNSADLVRAAGEKPMETRWVAGVRFWF
jgi:copper resistance protein B